MSNLCTYGTSQDELATWGCKFSEITPNSPINSIKLCHVDILQLDKMAKMLTDRVLDTAWMLELDPGTRRSYNITAKETADTLVEIFNLTSSSTGVTEEFGEIMVSMGAGRALESIFEHEAIPVAELWKPQLKQNEGFDFHTLCLNELLNFGEAKFSSGANSHGKALNQIEKFIAAEKHYRDRVHLVSLKPGKPIENLDTGKFGVIAAFSLNTANPLEIYKNAIKSVKDRALESKVDTIYLIGVSHGN